MSKITCHDYDGSAITQFYQWDLNRSITIKGYDGSSAPIIHFGHRCSKFAIPVSPKKVEDDYIAIVPNELLQKSQPIFVYLFVETVDDGARSNHICTIPVIPRPKPGDYMYEDNVKYVSLVEITENIEILNNEMADLREYIHGLGYTDPDSPGNLPSFDSIDAESVVFSTDLLTTAAIGNISLVNGQAVIPAVGKNIKQVWDAIFVKEKNPTISQPKVTLSSPNSEAYEVGTVVMHNFTASFNPGSYEFGPETGVVVNLWKITDSEENTIEASSGAFPEITVEDDTSYGITARAEHSAGAIPLTNIQNPYPAGAISEGEKYTVSGKTTGFRRSFYGTTEDKNPLTSDAIRGLKGKSTSALKNGDKFSVEIPVGAMRVVIAYPATLRDMTSVVDVRNMGMEIIDGFNVTGPSIIAVEGVNGYEAIDYKVYVYEYSAASDEANTYNVTI